MTRRPYSDEDEDKDAWQRAGSIGHNVTLGAAFAAWDTRWAAIDKAAPREVQEIEMAEGLIPLGMAHAAGVVLHDPDDEGVVR